VDLDSEATNSFVRAAAGRVFASLARVAADGSLVSCMHIEFTPAQALEMARHLDECARSAIAKDVPAASWVREVGLAPPVRD
jgi:hypothetical protein